MFSFLKKFTILKFTFEFGFVILKLITIVVTLNDDNKIKYYIERYGCLY